MHPLLLISPFLVTSLYAVYEMWKSPHAREWSIAVIGSAGLMVFCLFWLEPLLLHFHTASGFGPLGDFLAIRIKTVTIQICVFITHVVLLGILFWGPDPDIPYVDTES